MLEKKIISQAELERVLEEQPTSGKKLGELLIQKGFIKPKELQCLLREQTWRKRGVWLKLPSAV
jgi:hypothetical protein